MDVLVSAIIPTYNRADLLGRALDSAMAQDHRPLEAVVIDDGSTDNTPALIEAYRPQLKAASVDLVVHRQSNGRAPKARNAGMRLASGRFFAFLDSDDLWRPRFASTLAGLLGRHAGAGLAFCGIEIIDLQDRAWSRRRSGLENGEREGVLTRPFESILRHMPLQTSGVMVRREVIDDVGGFDLELPVVEDWDLWYRIARKFDFAYTLDFLACNRSHPANLPKYDLLALTGSVRMNLKHLPDVLDEDTRQMLIDRIGWQVTLLQEELLRRGKAANGCSDLLRLAPRTPRFMVGSALRAAPTWVGRSYGHLIRLVGELKRGMQT